MAFVVGLIAMATVGFFWFKVRRNRKATDPR